MWEAWIPRGLILLALVLYVALARSRLGPEKTVASETPFRSPTASAAPTASPTFVVPAVVMYLSSRAVRGDFALSETPEVVCEENARVRFGCGRVAALISTSSAALRRRGAEMRGIMVSFQHDGHVMAHDATDIWAGDVRLDLAERAWTGSGPNGQTDDSRCDDWTSTSGFGAVAERTLSDGDARCSEHHRIMCLCRTIIS